MTFGAYNNIVQDITCAKTKHRSQYMLDIFNNYKEKYAKGGMMRFYNDAELMKLSDEELKSLFLKLRADINSGKKNKKSTVEEEIYYCYVYREIERRPQFRIPR